MIDFLVQTKVGDLYLISEGNDLQLTDNGDIAIVSSFEFLKQMIGKAFLTELEENNLNPSFGTNLMQLASRWDNSAYLNSLLQDSILDTLAQVHFITRDSDDPNEKIGYIESIKIEEKDNFSVSIYLTLLTEGKKLLIQEIGRFSI